jgi:hypothetical protein
MKRHVLSKTASFHTLFIKKKKEKPKMVPFLNGTVAFLLPLDARGRGRRRLFSPALPVPSFSETTKMMPTQNTPLA